MDIELRLRVSGRVGEACCDAAFAGDENALRMVSATVGEATADAVRATIVAVPQAELATAAVEESAPTPKPRTRWRKPKE